MRKTLLVAALFAFAGSAFAAPVTYKIDPNHTNVLASWSHFGFSNPSLNFGQADGTIVYDADKVSASSVQVTLPLTGLSALADQFYDHLTSADWFDAAKYPSATFKSTKVEAAGEGKLKVTGDLTVKGVTKPVVLEVKLNKAGVQPLAKRAAVGFDATATVKRSEFGLGNYVPNVSDEVSLRITTEAIVPKAE
ncbi:YceI family protein [Pseudoxanthomonas sacheonensis]|uniref:YceI family protein n=1 Tax=Pseudoxanthomonas sacheonensis TaxID=443615 RepID=UPI0013D11962|nr:YceI family protein [Pseudoxanthomonas sacheonensis]KAF1708402.1 polyisoprenoid-binding protein [Pseudoxanthomonas sacheonensis]